MAPCLNIQFILDTKKNIEEDQDFKLQRRVLKVVLMWLQPNYLSWMFVESEIIVKVTTTVKPGFSDYFRNQK